MDIINCLKLLGPEAEQNIDIDLISGRIQQLQKDGMSAQEAHLTAIDQHLTSLAAERADILKQVDLSPKSGGLSTGLNKKAAQDAIRSAQSAALGPKSSGQGPTNVESKATIEAAADAIGRGGRKAAYSSDPNVFNDIQKPGMVTVPSEDGGAYMVPAGSVSEVIKLDREGRQAEILGYPNEKPQGGEQIVIQAKDAEGRTVQDVVTDEAGLEAAVKQAEAAAGPGGTVDVKRPNEALNERASGFDDDTGTLDGFEGEGNRGELGEGTEIDADALIGALTDAAVETEPTTFTVKHNATGNIMKGLYPGTKMSTNQDGSRDVTIPSQAPRATQGDPAMTSPKVIKLVSKIFDDGQTEQRGRIQVANPNKTTLLKASMPAVIRLGRALNEINETNTDRRTNLLTGMAWMYENGFVPKKVRLKGANGTWRDHTIPEKGEPPLNMLVDGHEGTTAVTYGEAAGIIKGKSQTLHAALVKRHDELRADMTAMTTGTQQERNRATLRVKKNIKSLQKEISDIEETLIEQFGEKFTDGQFDYRDIEQKMGEQQEDDTRRFPSEEQQAKESAKDTGGKDRGPISVGKLAERNNRVAHSQGIPKTLADMAVSIMKLVGMKNQLNIVDIDGAKAYRKELLAAKAEEEAKPTSDVDFINSIDMLVSQIDDSIARLEAGKEGRIIYNSDLPYAELRVPLILMRDPTGRKANVVMTHELGHLLQRVSFDQAPKEVQDAIKRSMHGTKASTSNVFEENFANMLLRYLLDLDHRAEVEAVTMSDAQKKQQLKDIGIVRKFFGAVAEKLKAIWKAGKEYKVDEAYKDFVEAMVGVSYEQRNETPPVTLHGKKHADHIRNMTFGPYMAYRPTTNKNSDYYSAADVRALGAKAIQSRRAAPFVNGGKRVADMWNMLQDNVLRSSDAFLRAMKTDRMTKVADQFHHQPGTKKTERAFFEEVRHVMGQRQSDIDKIMNGLPKTKKKRGYWNREEIDTQSGEYVQLMEMLRDGVSKQEFEAVGGVVGETGARVREFLDMQLGWLQGHGVKIDRRKNYFPVVADTAKWTANEAAVMAALKKAGIPKEYAEKLFEAVTKGDGYLADIYEQDDKLLSPGFKFMKRRKLPPEVIKALDEYMVNDLNGILQFYTKSATDRGLVQSRWGLSANEQRTLETEFRVLGISQHINSPVAKLHLNLSRDLKEGKITLEQYRTVKNKVLEAYFGRLGANIDPRWQKFQTGMIIYQNVRLLSLSTLTALVDAGQLVWRAESTGTAWTGLKKFFDKQERAELYRLAHQMGIIQDELTSHVLNDQVTTQFMSARAKDMNEKFFRAIFMHQWTNMTRVMGLSIGREFMKEHAVDAMNGDTKSQRHLEELGVTPAQIDAWVAAGHPTLDSENAGDHAEVISGLGTFVDESIVRPDASTRPAWASDRRFQLLFHLKSFMWGYQEVILRRLWNRAKNEPNIQKALLSGGMSAALLVAATLPLAVAGYELRRLLSWWGNPPAQTNKDGLDYLAEVAQRAGYLGIFQFIADAEQAQDFGRMSILSLAGPTLGQLEEFISQDLVSSSSRAIPFLAQSGAARSIYRDFLRD